MYAYVKTYICMICIYLTEKVNRLKLARLHTSASDSAKIYTIDKFGTKSSQMARKRIHKFHNILWNAYWYLKRRIMGFDRYLHTRILSWRNQKPLATPPPPPPPTGIVESQNGSIHSHSMVSVMFLLINLLFCFCMQLFRLGHLTVCLVDMLCWIIALKLIWLYNGWYEYVPLLLYQISTRRKSTDSSCHILLTLVSSVLISLSLSRSPAPVEDSKTGYAGSLPDQLGILHLYLLSPASVEDSETGYAGSLPDQLGILHLYLLSCFRGGLRNWLRGFTS